MFASPSPSAAKATVAVENNMRIARRTEINIETIESIDEEDLIEEEDLVITITSEGNIKSVSFPKTSPIQFLTVPLSNKA